MSAKRFSELSPIGRLWASVLIVLSVALVITAERDIQRRPSSQVRGSKLIWRLACLNAIGAAGYLRWGRRAKRG